MPLYTISHATTYRYADPVAVSHQALHLEPLTSESQECLHFALEVRPQPLEPSTHTDYFGNNVRYITITEPHQELRILSTSQVTVTPSPVSLFAGPTTCGELRNWLEDSAEPAAHLARQFLYESPFVPRLPALSEFARRYIADDRPALQSTMDLCAGIHRQFKFDRSATTIATPLEEFFRLGRGVCQDFAHLAIAALRASGLAARYVSGYLLTEPPPGQKRLLGADASHAWASVFLPDAGWVDFDPTNNCLCAERHISVARGRDYGDVSPVRGVVTGGGEHTLFLGVTVAPIGD
ncbi:MAG: transglutaminase family protein [Opitutales bacterium]|jgi:transglutaminase-like putative cysteine protease